MNENVNQKKKQIVETGRRLFERFGMRRVSIEEICREAGVSKVTYYKHFKNKQALVLHIFKEISDAALARYNKIMASDMPYREKVDQLIQMKLDQADGVSMEFIRDFLHNADPEVAQWYQKIMQERMLLFRQNFVDAQERGDIRKDIKPEFIMYFLNLMIQVLDDDKITQLYDSPKEFTRELMNFLYYGMLTRKAGDSE